MRSRRSRKSNTSNLVLLCLGVFELIFIIVMIITFWIIGAVPDTLIQYVLGAGGLEAVALAGIKISKVVTGEVNINDIINEEELL